MTAPDPRTLVCPRCSSCCRETIVGWLACRFCRWQGRIQEVEEGRKVMKIEISGLAVTPASEMDGRSGLLAYLAFAVNGLGLDGVTLRRTAAGRLALSFPARTDGGGRRHPVVRPADDEVRREIERQVLDQLGELVA